ncbi:hypothetical protein GCM10011400_54670 [Paraburkholderia caffeinilytica]|uniref:Uncharacterized protein n=1 Tax=Paraburkholderia caffeinilytica TaxID=1761016 RepID=A0ABQ1N924_9BURK|nr:hypothetical protein GCM10011400_54670 [Paraburkholderia caffeinilytica]
MGGKRPGSREARFPKQKTRRDAGFHWDRLVAADLDKLAGRLRLARQALRVVSQCRASPGVASLPVAGGVSSSLLRAQKKRSGK